MSSKCSVSIREPIPICKYYCCGSPCIIFLCEFTDFKTILKWKNGHKRTYCYPKQNRMQRRNAKSVYFQDRTPIYCDTAMHARHTEIRKLEFLTSLQRADHKQDGDCNKCCRMPVEPHSVPISSIPALATVRRLQICEPSIHWWSMNIYIFYTAIIICEAFTSWSWWNGECPASYSTL